METTDNKTLNDTVLEGFARGDPTHQSACRFERSRGTLHYDKTDAGCRLVVWADEGLADYYRSLIPKWFDVNRPRWAPHITVVRTGVDTPSNLDAWGKYEGETAHFHYSPAVRFGKIYFWLNCISHQLEDIREELGLPMKMLPHPDDKSVWPIPPEGYKKFFHMTLANQK